MTQSTIPINTQLVNSLAQIILSLTEEERKLLLQKIDNPHLTNEEIKSQLKSLQDDINLGISQLEQGDYTEYNETELPNLLAKIKNRGQESQLFS